jgi:hypothetical protein
VFLRLSTILNAFGVIICVPYRAPGSVLPLRTLQKLSSFSSGELIIVAHSSLSPTVVCVYRRDPQFFTTP